MFWALKWTICTLAQITASSSTQLVLISPFEDPMSQPGCYKMPDESLQDSLCFSPMLFFGSISLNFLDITLLGLRANPKFWLNSNNPSIWTSLLYGKLNALLLMPFSILYLLVMVFQTALGYFLHSTFCIKAATLGFTGWLRVFAIWMDCIEGPFFMTLWTR